MPDENKIRDAADAVKGVVEAVPVYQDIVRPAAKELGTALQTVAKTVHIALAPISGLVWGYDKIKEFVSTSVARRLERTATEDIQTPPPQVAGPALEALKYTGHDENLREMFAKLLATAMDKKTASLAHPSFVEIVKQLSSDEAKICRHLKTGKHVAVINLEEAANDKRRVVVRYFSLLGTHAGCQIPELIQSYLNNLNRLGLIHIEFDNLLLEREPYDELKKSPELLEVLQIITEAKHNPEFIEGYIVPSAFGRQFFEACVD